MPRFNRAIVATLLAASFSFAGFAAAGDAPAAAPARGRGPAGSPAGLGAAMKDMDSAYRSLKAEAVDPAKLDAALKDVATMQRDAAIAKTFAPPSVAKLTGDEKAKALESYRTQMVTLQRTLLDLEQAIADKKADDVKKGIAAIETIMDKGHAEFIPAA